jgi:hypothetical protein
VWRAGRPDSVHGVGAIVAFEFHGRVVDAEIPLDHLAQAIPHQLCVVQ